MNTFPSILPSVESRNKINEGYEFNLFFDKLTEADKDSLIDFMLYNSGDQFYYWTKEKYTYNNNTNYIVSENTNFVVVKDSDNAKTIIALADSSATYYTYLPTSTSVSYSDVIYAPSTFIVNQRYYSGDILYASFSTSLSDLKVVVRQVDSKYLILSVYNGNEVVTKKISITKRPYSMNSYHYDLLMYSIAFRNNSIVLAHNNHYVEVNLKRDITGITIDATFYKAINELVVSNSEVDGECLKGIYYWLGNTVGITVYSQSVVLSKVSNVYVYGRLRYITEFKNYSNALCYVDSFSYSSSFGYRNGYYYTYFKLKTI